MLASNEVDVTEEYMVDGGIPAIQIGTRLYRKLNDGRYPNAPEKGIIGAVSASITLTLISMPRPLNCLAICSYSMKYEMFFCVLLQCP